MYFMESPFFALVRDKISSKYVYNIGLQKTDTFIVLNASCWKKKKKIVEAVFEFPAKSQNQSSPLDRLCYLVGKS